MAKGGKSSASSGTRKKHAKKALAGTQPEELIPKEKKQKKKERGQKKKEPRVKVYIPPVKPAPTQPDPLETTGLVHTLPAELLIVLRSFNKKAQVTKIRALEELQSAWVETCRKEGEDGTLVHVLVEMLPVWLHHVSALFVHHSRRVRLLTAGIHASLLQIHAVHEQILFFLREMASPSQIESILGTWCMAIHDVDRSVATMAQKSWNNAISVDGAPSQTSHLVLDERFRPSLIAFMQRAILDPNGVYTYLNPPPPVSVPQPLKKGARKEDPEQASRSKAEELEESEPDRAARLRVGAFGAVRRILETIQKEPSDDLVEFFKNPALWSSLHHAEQCPFVELESFGFGQPIVRKAGWTLVQTLLSIWKGHLEPLLPILSSGILRSAWVEPDTTVLAVMWQPLLFFLKEFPNSWEVERIQDYHKDDGGDDSDSDESDSEDKKPIPNPPEITSIAYQEFLRFLELGCSGSPLQGYPTVMVIISTIPTSILASSGSASPLADMFGSFWKVLDGRALSSLQRSATSAAFLSSLFECMLLLIRRIRGHAQTREILFGSAVSPDAAREVQQFASEQIIKVWRELANKRLRVEQRAAARLVAQTLLSLRDLDEGLCIASWDAISAEIKGAVEPHPALVAAFLKIFNDRFKHTAALRDVAVVLTGDILNLAVEKCETALKAEQTDSAIAPACAEFLVNMLDQFREGLFDAASFSQRMDEMIAENAFRFLSVAPSLLLAYLSHRKQENQCLRVWQVLLFGVSQHPDVAETSIKSLLDAVERNSLPSYLRPSTGEVDALVQQLLSEVLSGEPARGVFVRQVLLSPDYFLSEAGYTTSLASIINAFTFQVDLALSDAETPLAAFEPSLDLMAALFQHPPRTLPRQSFDALMPYVFIFAYLLPLCYDPEDDNIFSSAIDLWNQWLKDVDQIRKTAVLSEVKARLNSLLCDTQARPLPRDILYTVSQAPVDLGFKLPSDIFPTPQELDDMLHELSPDPIHPSLAAVDKLIPPASGFNGTTSATQLYDSHGFSSYARVVSALLQVLIEDRKAAKQNTWALRHFHALEIYALDFQRVPSAPSPVFQDAALSAELFTIISKVEQVTTYVLTSSADDGWRAVALNAVMNNKTETEDLGTLSMFLVNVIDASRTLDTARDSRTLRNILQHVFHDVERDEADLWMLLARKLENKAPQTSMAIVSAITEFAPEPPRLDKYRNELAAGFLGVKADKANTEGLLLLRKLAASAPNTESDIVFLPQPRAVNIMKVCQQWIASDEEIDEEVESYMTLIFFYLAPILQDVPGAHWGLIFDILENNLENSSMTDDDTLAALARSLRLVILIQDLAMTNKSLRSDWEERKMPILALVRDLATVSPETIKHSTPVSTCRGLVLSIIQSLPRSLIDQETLPKMSHLISDSSGEVQKVAYLFLQNAAKKRTEYFVIEAGVDTEASIKIDLPPQILDIIQRDVGFEQGDSDEASMFGYLLGWMLLFDLFQDASLKVRSSYIEQLRNLDIISSYFIPTLLRLLMLDQGPLKAFKLDIWSVDEFHVEYYETGSSFGLQLLAAHLYYRALLTVPSLIHTWISDCKDRQLSSGITNYTSQYFSPVIIQTELAHVKSPESTALLVDDNLTIKVANAVNEVVASYLVDEHQLEIKLKIPPDWPLHKIEIKDVKTVGVDGKRWRAWILAVQQIIWSHNGRIIDGLGLFKKNVTLHFEGQVECAICYSIISVMDGTLPRKPCKTCKNRFHAVCLYKWFNSSHSSSCPLCRSDIF